MRHVRGAPGAPGEIEIIPETLMLIEPGDRAIHPVAAFEADRRADLTTERLRRGIKKILQDLAKLEVFVERDGQWLRLLHLVGFGRLSTTRENETKDG